MNATEQSPINEKALRRWINENYEDGTSCATWTLQECMDWVEEHHAHGLDAFRQTPYRAWDIYRDASPAARETVDAVFNAVINVASPLVGLSLITATGLIGCSFTWHDGAQYRVDVARDGSLVRLYRYELTGRWIEDEEDGLIPDFTWRTVRAFTRDRAGKVLAPALAGRRATAAWTEASTR